MRAYTKTLIGLSVITALIYGVLVGLGMMEVVVGPDRLWPFDLRLLGYSVEDAHAYLGLLDDDAAAFYIGPLRLLDTVFPVLLGIWIGWVWWGISDNLHSWSRVIMLIVPGVYTLMDLLENALVADMVRLRAVPPDPALVALASSYTVSKFVTLLLALLVLVVVGIRRWQHRKA